MDITKLKEQLVNLDLFDVYDNLIAYTISTKVTNGIRTDIPCITFHVEHKKDVSQLDVSQIIPSTFLLEGIEIVTDVVQSSKVQHLGAPYNSSNLINPSNSNIQSFLNIEDEVKRTVKLVNGIDILSDTPSIANVNYFNKPSNKTVEPISLNYRKNRPLLGGSSSIYVGASDATLGLIVRDSTDDSVVAMSNNHVYAASQFTGAGALSGDFKSTLGLSARQPASPSYSPYGNSDYRQDIIGIHKRCVPLDITGYNQVDCAIVQLTGYSLIQALCTQVTGFKETGPYQFATTQEIDSLIDPTSPNYQSPIFRNGRTLGPMGYPGNLYSKDHLSYSVSVPISEVKTDITNIESIKIKKVDSDFGRTYYASLLKTVDNDYYLRGYSTGNTPYEGNVLSAFEYVGNFSYYGSDSLATWGLSSDKLVYYGYGRVPGDIISMKWNVVGQQLPSYVGVTKILLGDFCSFILSGTDLYVIGSNGSTGSYYHEYGTLGFGVSGDEVESWSKVPGQWKDIYTSTGSSTSILALSTDGSVFFTCGKAEYIVLGRHYWSPYVTDYYNLTANHLNIGRYEKLFLPSTNLTFLNFGLSADGRSLMKFELVGDTTTNNPNRRIQATRLNGDWSNKIDITSVPFATTYLLASGSNLYTLGKPAYQPTYSFTNFFAGASLNYSDTTFSLVSGISAQQCSGWANLADQSKGEAVSFLSGGKWYMGGRNDDGMFGGTLTAKDNIIVTEIGNANVNGYNDYEAVKFSDCLFVESRESAFPVIQGGDSGTAAFALLSSNIPSLSAWKCIGLLFAGNAPSNTNYGIAGRIDHIVDKLKIKPWDGTIPSTPSKITNTVYTSNIQKIPTITLSGRQFFNIGLSSAPVPAPVPGSSQGSTTSTPASSLSYSSPLYFNLTTHTIPPCATSIIYNGLTIKGINFTLQHETAFCFGLLCSDFRMLLHAVRLGH